MTFDHDAENAIVAAADLSRDIIGNDNLARIVLRAVGVAHVDHYPCRKAGFAEFLSGRRDAGRVIIRLFAAA